MNTIPRVGFYTLGCKLNFSETATIARQFKHQGYRSVAEGEPADVFVINTCSVTENANKKFRSLVRQLNRKNPDAVIIATGCYAQLEPEALSRLDQVDMVVGIKDKFRILDFLPQLQHQAHTGIHACEIENVNNFDAAYSTSERTRAFLKIQDGCDYKCSYCTIPKARGISRSDRLEHILANARTIIRQGISEIVLTGVNIGDYGKGEHGDKAHRHTFLDLLEALDELEGDVRFRLSSVEPNLLTDEIIAFVTGSRKFVPHFHIPLQSGSDAILKRMRRRYDTALYRSRVEMIKHTCPDAAIGVDVIVGFPGETDEYFTETFHFLESLDISYLHVFTYSERPGTEAADSSGAIPMPVRNKRSKILRALSLRKKNCFYRSQLGKTRQTIFESANKDGYLYGFTDNYLRIKIPYEASSVHRLIDVELAELQSEVITGIPANGKQQNTMAYVKNR